MPTEQTISTGRGAARFALCLAERIHELAVRANIAANEDYAQWVGTNTKAEDDAWAECQRTARLADAAQDALIETENGAAQ